MGYIWQETRDNPTIPLDQIKGIKMTVYAEKKTLFTKPYESVFEFVEIYPIDIVKLDGTVHRWKYVDDVLINQHSEELSDNIITTGKFDKNGEMLIYSSFNVQ